MFKKILCTILIATLTLGPNVPSYASGTNETNEINLYGEFNSKDELTDYLIQHDVPESKIGGLLDKVDNNIPWDCYLEEKVSMIPDSFSEFDVNTDIKEKYFRFEDGSFIEVSVGGGDKIENYKNITKERSAITDSFGTLYTNHRVSKFVGTTSASFVANFYVARTGPSQIYTYANSAGLYNSPYDANASGFGLTAPPSIELIREVEKNNQAALCRLTWFNQVTVSAEWSAVYVGGGTSLPIGSTCNLYLALINNKMYVDSKLPF